MFKPRLQLLFLPFIALFYSSSAFAQTDMRVVVANMSQDIKLLVQEVKSLRLEVEQVKRQNLQLKKQVLAQASNTDTDAKFNNLSSAIETLRREYRQADEAQKRAIIAEVSRQIDSLARQTEGALKSVVNAVDSQPNAPITVSFSDDYPQTGKPYTVRSGDTLSGIARAHGSRVKDIQNANKIVNPARDLQVGQTIFIPIAE